ncbi:hypothetical protein O181_008522, partial [Austropuccinia psidii MF-1]|nr:hypothetical protein [Austropuccinia psidii MF-1]
MLDVSPLGKELQATRTPLVDGRRPTAPSSAEGSDTSKCSCEKDMESLTSCAAVGDFSVLHLQPRPATPHHKGINRGLKFISLLLICGVFLALVALSILILKEIKAREWSCSNPQLTIGRTQTSALGTLIGIGPEKGSVAELNYRQNWTNPNPTLAPLAFDALEPLDSVNGTGLGWTIVFIHGLGAVNASHAYQWRDALLSKFSDPLHGTNLGNLTGLRFIFPKAPIGPVTIYDSEPDHGARPRWFDITHWEDLNYLEDEEGERQSIIGISAILKDQINSGKIQMNQTIFSGFSQGAVLTLLLTLTFPQPPAAAILLSGYLPLPFRLKDLAAPSPSAYQKTAIYWLH